MAIGLRKGSPPVAWAIGRRPAAVVTVVKMTARKRESAPSNTPVKLSAPSLIFSFIKVTRRYYRLQLPRQGQQLP